MMMSIQTTGKGAEGPSWVSQPVRGRYRIALYSLIPCRVPLLGRLGAMVFACKWCQDASNIHCYSCPREVTTGL